MALHGNTHVVDVTGASLAAREAALEGVAGGSVGDAPARDGDGTTAAAAVKSGATKHDLDGASGSSSSVVLPKGDCVSISEMV